MSILQKKTLCLITGASRGIGKEIAKQLASEFARNSTIILLARNELNLEQVAVEISDQVDTEMDVEICTIDLSHFDDQCSKRVGDLLSSKLSGRGPYENTMLVHNAGTLGDISKRASDWTGQDVSAHMDTNFTSMITLTSAWLKALQEHKSSQGDQWIINITSLVAIKGFPSLSLYAAGKAAREGFMRVLGEEEPDYRVLNYSPGPVVTDMNKQLQNDSFDEKIREYFKECDKKGRLLSTTMTVQRMIGILKKNSFVSGSRIDYFDENK